MKTKNIDQIQLLIIEDDLDYANYITMILGRVSSLYKIDIAENMKEATDLMMTDKHYDFIISDLSLPDSEGISIISKIHAFLEETPILILSNHDNAQLGLEAIKEGAADYLSKRNVTPDLLHRMIIYSIERKKIVDELEEKRAHLYKMQKMESLVTLVGGISHDFNNIMTLIRGYTDLINDNSDNPDKVKRYNSQVSNAVKRAISLIDQLSNFTRINLDKSQKIKIDEYIETKLSMLQNILRENIDLEIDLQTDGAIVNMSQSDLEQILINPVINSNDAILATGTISIRTYIENSCTICESIGPMIRIDIEDSGKGIEKDVLSKVFDPYFSTKEQGTGLRLSTVYGIIKQYKGCINIESIPERGTILQMAIPQFIDDNSIIKQSPDTLTTISKNPEQTKIMVIDDEPSILQFLKLVLENKGFQVVTRNDPLEAKQDILNGKLRVDLVISDVIMPNLDGITLATQIHEKYEHLPILLMSGYSPKYYQDYDAQQFELLRKPFDKIQIIEKVYEMIKSSD